MYYQSKKPTRPKRPIPVQTGSESASAGSRSALRPPTFPKPEPAKQPPPATCNCPSPDQTNRTCSARSLHKPKRLTGRCEFPQADVKTAKHRCSFTSSQSDGDEPEVGHRAEGTSATTIKKSRDYDLKMRFIKPQRSLCCLRPVPATASGPSSTRLTAPDPLPSVFYDPATRL